MPFQHCATTLIMRGRQLAGDVQNGARGKRTNALRKASREVKQGGDRQ